MFEIKNLTRIFVSSNSAVIALNNINLSFLDTGLVFITGKSGSGKSTLLNQIGGLDKPTSGTILFNNIEITSLSEDELSKYRNEYIGFIFQDFALIETMTVYENIMITLEMKKMKDDSSVDEILKELDILDLKDRIVTKLSAGQKQRVAIARAVIKKPKVILADEPTGNLDHESGKLVLNYLKKLSKDILVIVISHNQNDAYTYAERIIKLENGYLVSDVTSDCNCSTYIKKNDVLYVNNLQEVDNNECHLIVKSINNHTINDMKPVADLYHPTNNIDPISSSNKSNDLELSNLSLSNKSVVNLHHRILKAQTKKSIWISMISMVLLVIMALCQMLNRFTIRDVLYDEVIEHNEPYTILYKHNEDSTSNIIGYTEDELPSSNDAEYIYNLVFNS